MVNPLRSFLSSCHPVIRSLGNLVIMSYSHPVILLSYHQSIWSSGHLDIWSSSHLVMESSSHPGHHDIMTHHHHVWRKTTFDTNGRTDNIRTYRHASQTIIIYLIYLQLRKTTSPCQGYSSTRAALTGPFTPLSLALMTSHLSSATVYLGWVGGQWLETTLQSNLWLNIDWWMVHR